MRSVQVIAHRGGPAYAPENTLAAFKNAIAMGVDGLELDVHLSRDGEVVVIHDETVNRTTTGAGRVADLSLADLRVLDAGQGERVPTFNEVLTLAKTAGVELLVELKSPHLYPGLESRVAQAIVAADYVNKTIVQSFDPHSVATVHALNPALSLCQLYEWRLFSPPPGVGYIAPLAEKLLLNPWLVRRAHAEGRQVFVWFGRFKHSLALRLLLTLGVDGLIVDDPLALVRILSRPVPSV
jgi:glycerophosphoryl diester phosphodiesterase